MLYQILEKTVIDAMEGAGVKDGEPIDTNALHKAVASAIFQVIKSDDFIRYIDRELGKRIAKGNRP